MQLVQIFVSLINFFHLLYIRLRVVYAFLRLQISHKRMKPTIQELHCREMTSISHKHRKLIT